MNFEKELSSMRRRLENITKVIDPPTLKMIVVDENQTRITKLIL